MKNSKNPSPRKPAGRIRAAIQLALLLGVGLSFPALAQAQEKIIRLGMIGLDTTHVIAFTSHINNPKNNTGCKVVAAFPGGSPDFKTSWDRVGSSPPICGTSTASRWSRHRGAQKDGVLPKRDGGHTAQAGR